MVLYPKITMNSWSLYFYLPNIRLKTCTSLCKFIQYSNSKPKLLNTRLTLYQWIPFSSLHFHLAQSSLNPEFGYARIILKSTMIISFLVFVIKYNNNSRQMFILAHTSRTQSVMVRNTWRWGQLPQWWQRLMGDQEVEILVRSNYYLQGCPQLFTYTVIAPWPKVSKAP